MLLLIFLEKLNSRGLFVLLDEFLNLMFPQTECTSYVLVIYAIFIHHSYLFLFFRRYWCYVLGSLNLKNILLHDFSLFLQLQSLRTVCNSLIRHNLITIVLIKLFLQSLLYLTVYFTAIYLLYGLVQLFLLLLVAHSYVVLFVWKSLVLVFLKSRRSIFIFLRIVVIVGFGFVFLHIKIILLI